MKKTSPLRTMLGSIVLALASPPALAAGGFSFGVVSHATQRAAEETALRGALEDTDSEKLAFVVVNGLKAKDEPCTDDLYQQRKTLLQGARHPLILSVAASDWADCRTEIGKSDALAKLSKVRDLYFPDGFSLGGNRIALSRQSTAAKFRGFAENARWVTGGIMFATVNLPDDNNHYLPDAGRNSEFEDRVVANRNWLNRVFTLAQRGRLGAVVLFCDADPLAPPAENVRRDGFAEARKLILALAARFPGKVLIVHGRGERETHGPRIEWRENVGEFGVPPGWMKVTVDAAEPALFSVEEPSPQAADGHR